MTKWEQAARDKLASNGQSAEIVRSHAIDYEVGGEDILCQPQHAHLQRV